MRVVRDAFAQYCTRFPAERGQLGQLANFLEATPDGRLFDRKNFNGHITASAFVIDPAQSAMLLIQHAFLNRWLQPGGHVDPGESPIRAALREVKEEIGIDESELTLIPLDDGNPEIPLDIDSHDIPANKTKQEGAHVHHDFRYLFIYRGKGNFALDEKEVAGCKWAPFEELLEGAAFRRVIEKIRQVVNSGRETGAQPESH
jgi:8-oxo-dGTP pyrophosphatase MutT (NUDIX family)